LVRDLQRVVRALEGVDALLLETASDLLDLAALAELGERDAALFRLPVLFSLTGVRGRQGGLFTKEGTELGRLAIRAEQYGPAALGLNCGREVGMEDMARWFVRPARPPFFLRPNAGTPTRVGERWVYPHTAADMAAGLPPVLGRSVRMVGGCCGTTPEYIAAFRKVIDAWNAR
jgi:methionine synthase I (cobalamin-dependent)